MLYYLRAIFQLYLNSNNTAPSIGTTAGWAKRNITTGLFGLAISRKITSSTTYKNFIETIRECWVTGKVWRVVEGTILAFIVFTIRLLSLEIYKKCSLMWRERSTLWPLLSLWSTVRFFLTTPIERTPPIYYLGTLWTVLQVWTLETFISTHHNN